MRILVVSGSTRALSTNAAFCRTAPHCAPPGVIVEALTDCALLPHFNPDHDAPPLPAPVAALRRSIAAADAVLFCTPEYAGTLPGSFKNLLDWTVGGTELTGKPVAWAKVAADPRRDHPDVDRPRHARGEREPGRMICMSDACGANRRHRVSACPNGERA